MCRDFQVYRLAMTAPAEEGKWSGCQPHGIGYRLSACRGFRVAAAGVGAPKVPGFEAFDGRANATASRPNSLEKRLEEIRRKLGEETLAKVMAANEADMDVYQNMHQIYATKLRVLP